MTKTLDVYLHKKIIGKLIQDINGNLSFAYSLDWLADLNATKISCSLPLQQEVFKKKYCQAFFEGILPEATQRKLIAKNLGISPNNDFSMLEKIGGECAGALSFIPSGKKLNTDQNHYHTLKKMELSKILQELPFKPLLAGEKGVRLSLAGVQDKLAVYIEDGGIFIPLDSSPSTHILKPDSQIYKGVIFNEEFCLRLAKQIGLSVIEADLKKAEKTDYLLIKRYDRILVKTEKNSTHIKRIHQEDFCQALGILSTNKYQAEGGPSLKQCFDLIRRESSTPVLELRKMLDAVIFNYLIGNCDAHAKNFSFLYFDSLRLAPLYDLICTLYYENLDKKMAMKLGGEYRIMNITFKNFDKLADEIGFAKPIIHKKVLEFIDAILSLLPTLKKYNQVQKEVANLIQMRCEHLKISFQRSV